MAEIIGWLNTPAHVMVTAVLGFAALVHMVWGFGIWWPLGDEDRLVNAVVGARTATRMPGMVPCLIVAAGLGIGATLPWWPDGTLRQLAMAALAAIFALRGVMPLLPSWRRATAREPFATLDRRLFGPLSIGLAICFWVLAQS